MVGEKGLEPSRLAALVPKTSVSTNSTTRPRINIVKKLLSLVSVTDNDTLELVSTIIIWLAFSQTHYTRYV